MNINILQSLELQGTSNLKCTKQAVGMLFCIIIMSWAMVYEGRNPSKQRKRERLALLHLPINLHAPPKGRIKLTVSRFPCVFMRKSKFRLFQNSLLFKENKKHLETRTKIFASRLLWTKIRKGNTSLLSMFSLLLFNFSYSFHLGSRFYTPVTDSRFSVLMRSCVFQ